MAPSIQVETAPAANSVIDVPQGSTTSFPVPDNIKSLRGTVYASAQLLVQQVAFGLSGNIFSYSPEGFGLDSEISQWKLFGDKHGLTSPVLTKLETRQGAASVLLGYLFNQSEGLQKVPQTVLAASKTLEFMKPVLAQHTFAQSAPLSFHVAAVDYDSVTATLVTDYSSTISVARDLGLPLLGSNGVGDAQDIALLTTLLSIVAPSIHLYDGRRGIRETTKVRAVLPANTVAGFFEAATSTALTATSFAGQILQIIEKFNTDRGSSYQPFEYFGSLDAETVVVTFGSVENTLAGQVAEALSSYGDKVGAVNVRLYNPFIESEFLKVVPKSVKRIHVFGQVNNNGQVADVRAHSALFADVATAVRLTDSIKLSLHEHKYSRDKTWSPQDFINVLAKDDTELKLLPHDTQQFVFWDVQDSPTLNVPISLCQKFCLDTGKTIDHISSNDSLSLGGVVHSQVRVLPSPISAPYDIEDADVVFINDVKIANSFDVLRNVKTNSQLIVVGVADRDGLDAAVGPVFKKLLVEKSIQVYGLDLSSLGDLPAIEGLAASMSCQIAFWKIAYPKLTVDEIASKISVANGSDTEQVATTVASLVEKIVEVAIKKIEVPKDWQDVATPREDLLLAVPHPTGFAPVPISSIVNDDSASSAGSWVEAAKKLAFPEVYGVSHDLRPDIPVKIFIAKVQVNQRVTPSDYDRHVFHLELNISGTGMTYAIGEALGIHAPNNEASVVEFLDYYGLNAQDIVNVPSRHRGDVVETKTVFQSFRDDLDLFGKPPKKFYEQLAKHATDAKEKAQLEKLASADGAAELKKRIEVDFSTYIDVLEEFASARPPVQDLVELIAPLKRREYSIASSQKVHPNAVHLLIVVVDWIDSKGRKRFGQCSKYLADLKTGAEVVVSVKPSVMKLPASPLAPVIMAGLGTGLAPFKAFLEEKAWQKAQGHEIGPVYLFLGSRHQRQEYLYGELFEAYKNAGILTYIGAAFSRDQPQKIYIQDRIREAQHLLVDAFNRQKGTFYLCGPTWPVPDISALLIDIVSADALTRGETVDAARTIEELKEQERYILEVY